MPISAFWMSIIFFIVYVNLVLTYTPQPLPEPTLLIPAEHTHRLPATTTQPTLSPRQFGFSNSCYDDSNSDPNDCNGLSTTAKAGIGIGATISVILIASLLFWLIRRWRQKKKAEAGIFEIQDMRHDGSRVELEAAEVAEMYER